MLSSLKAHIWRFIHRQLTVPDLFLQYQISFFSHQVCVDLWRQVGKVYTWLHLLEWVNSLYTSRLWLRQRVEGSRVCPAECQLLDSRTSSQTPHCKTRITVSNQEEMQARCFPYEMGKIYVTPCTRGASLVPQAVKNPPAMQETWVPGLGRSSWRKEWLPTPVFLPGEFHGQRNLVGHSLWGCRESDMTEQLILSRKRWKLDKLLVLRSLKCDKARRAMIRVPSKFLKKKKKTQKNPTPPEL